MPHSVLIVEPEQLTRLTIAYMFNAVGYTAVEAGTYDTALGMMAGVWFSTLIVSPARDDPDGRQIAWEAKAIQPHVKVIVMTGFGQLGNPSSGIGLAPFVDAVVPKPFGLSDIQAAMKRVHVGSGHDFNYKPPTASS